MSDAAAQDRLFDRLSPVVCALARRGMVRSYRKNTVIVQEGDAGDSTFVLLQGEVRLFANNPEGHEITFHTVQAGDYFAEMSLDGGPRTASVVTLEPCVCSVVGRGELREHLAARPEFALEFVAHVIRRAREATRTARELALLDVYGRVVSALEGQRGPATADAPITLAPITHQVLASRVGASREMVSRLLKDLERGGYVSLGVKQITLRRKLPLRW
ncbi:MAG TPA: Crp/Fnr family transcriptional regulator [Ramlibacter sp.]|uniref:Crp/Fnr family transcriptional regulator n=1 Tax=Ramlibacter sp. TaxID=1917967 RepID=UPI002D2B375A|nr:Crp/Fnr family transcriptional regulator [Ramlibacter sp.]HZY20649.1 Crp/Fnr family transcriptional regulator [Ramlibacter sp.]